jgi:hypothetical protein
MSCGGGAHIERNSEGSNLNVGDEGHWDQNLTTNGFAVRFFRLGLNPSAYLHNRDVRVHIVIIRLPFFAFPSIEPSIV